MNMETFKVFFHKYEKYFLPLGSLVGFTWDNYAFKRIDLWLDQAVLLFYILVVGCGIFYITLFESGRFRKISSEGRREFALFAVQFALGGLFSAFVIFYTRSASVFTSWPFLLGLLILLVGNEFFREKYQRMAYQISVYFLALFSYLIFMLPIILGTMGEEIFILSGSLAVALTFLFSLLLYYFSPVKFGEARRMVFFSVAATYLAFNVLYFANIIPPIPLSLKEGGVYHLVEKSDAGGYRVLSEAGEAYRFWQKSPELHLTAGEPVFAFSAVFSPAELDTVIFHRWSYYDESSGEWFTTDRMSYPIQGGSSGGWRGYTKKLNIFPGYWRVEVETSRGQILGRLQFEAVTASAVPKLTEYLKK